MNGLSKENGFVLECVRCSVTDTDLGSELYENVDFEKVYRIASSHRIMGLVFRAVKPLKQNVPEDVFQKMSGADKMMIMSSVARNASIDEVTRSLFENNIRFILLKGAVIQDLYPEKYMRYSTDTDVLVEEKDYKRIPPIFKSLSYSFDSQNDKHYVFWKKPYVCVEVHKKLVSDCSFFDCVWENTVEENGRLSLKKEFELAYLLFHMAENFTKTGGIGIHSVTDVYLYLKRYGESLDGKLFESYLSELGLTKFFEAVKNLGEIWIGKKDADEFYVSLTEYIIGGGRSGDPAKAASGNIDPDKPLMLEKFRFFFSKLFLPYGELKKKYPFLGKAPFLLPVFWGMRITGIIFRPEHHGFERARSIMKNTDKKNVKKTSEILRKLELKS